MFILYKLLYKPVLDFLDKRANSIKEQIESTEKAKLEADKNMEETRKILLESKQESMAIRERARQIAKEEKEEIINKAKQEASNIILEAKATIEREVAKAKNELKQEIGLLSVSIAEKIINKSLQEKEHQRLIDEYIKDVEKLH
jgi:F-type H+-transporting ATPase subunit b